MGGSTRRARTPRVRRLRLTPEAELDLDEAHAWYHRQSHERAEQFYKPSTLVSLRFEAIPKPTSSWTGRCVELSSGGSRTQFFLRGGEWRLSSTPCSMALGIRNVGDDAETHNNAFEQPAGSRALKRSTASAPASCFEAAVDVFSAPAGAAASATHAMNPTEARRCLRSRGRTS